MNLKTNNMNNQIKTIDDVRDFVQYLVDNDQLFHFEDNPAEVTNSYRQPVFTADECKLINKRIDEICELDMLDDAFNYGLDHVMRAEELYMQSWRASLTEEQLKKSSWLFTYYLKNTNKQQNKSHGKLKQSNKTGQKFSNFKISVI